MKTKGKKKSQITKCYSYVRFSTPEQRKGDSLRRQLELSQKYADENGLILDTSFTYRDLGLSAFHGHHIDRGQLGAFLQAVKKKKIPKGSVLLVESLDRLSREKVLSALALFQEIIGHGIKIVTLTDGLEYSEESLNQNIGQLIISLTYMSRAHEESATKSKRLRAVWGEKRKKLDEVPLTSICPAWLRYDKDKQKFIAIPDRVKIVRKIFQLTLKGFGKRAIAKKFNEDGIDSWKGKNGWHASYIHKIQHNRAVIGEFQPCRIEGRKRKKVGNPVPNYYPAIIKEEVFYQVEQKLASRAPRGGRTGLVRNLFSSLAKCGYCGGPMQFVNKGKPPKGGIYLYCDNARRGRGCKSVSFRYPDFERAFLLFVNELDVSDLIAGEDEQSKISSLREELAGVIGNLLQATEKVKNLTEAIAETADKKVRAGIIEAMEKAYKVQEDLEAKQEVMEKELYRLMHSQSTSEEHLDSINDLIAKFASAKNKDLIELRLALRSQIRQIVDRIDVYPMGRNDEILERAEIWEKAVLKNKPKGVKKKDLATAMAVHSEMRDMLKQRILNSSKKIRSTTRTFVVYFKGGNYKVITPNVYDVSQFILKVNKSKDGVEIQHVFSDGSIETVKTKDVITIE